MPRIFYFRISVDDPKRAMDFYSRVFGWIFEFVDRGGREYWSITTGDKGQPGINGGMLRRNPMFSGTTNVIDVPSVDDFYAEIINGGGSEVLPKSPIPGVGWTAYFKDTEDNVFGIFQEDASAKM